MSITRCSCNGRSHHPLASEMTPQEHFEYCEKKNKQQRAYRARKREEQMNEKKNAGRD